MPVPEIPRSPNRHERRKAAALARRATNRAPPRFVMTMPRDGMSTWLPDGTLTAGVTAQAQSGNTITGGTR